MAGRGKFHQVGAGSRSRGQAKAENKARRSRKRASDRSWKVPGRWSNGHESSTWSKGSS